MGIYSGAEGNHCCIKQLWFTTGWWQGREENFDPMGIVEGLAEYGDTLSWEWLFKRKQMSNWPKVIPKI